MKYVGVMTITDGLSHFTYEICMEAWYKHICCGMSDV